MPGKKKTRKQDYEMNIQEIRRCLLKAGDSIKELFEEVERECADDGEVDLNFLQLNINDALFSAFGEDICD